MFPEMSNDLPDWFTGALATEPETGAVDVDGARIAYRAWGEREAPGLVLVHGGAAHSRWWDHIAPHLAHDRRVVALDLSGHGDSDHRSGYDLALWGREVLAAAEAAGIESPPTLVGHSLGGLVSVGLARRPDVPVGDVIVVDSPIGGLAAEEREESIELAQGKTRFYPTRAQAVSRFRPVPAQPSLPYVLDHIAPLSVRELDSGWTWKFDSSIFSGRVSLPTDVSRFHTRLAFFRAEFGLVPPRVREDIERAGGLYIDLPDAGHAPMLDQPLALLTGIRSLLAAWGVQRP